MKTHILGLTLYILAAAALTSAATIETIGEGTWADIFPDLNSNFTAINTEVTTHTGNTSNPHTVTKAQVGLGDVENYSAAGMPISTATQSALDGKVSGSNSIIHDNDEPATCTVGDIWVDTNGTSGSQLYACEATNTWALQAGGGGGGGTWGSIIGTLSNQTDLQSALDAKHPLWDYDYGDLINKPTIPTNNNQLTNGMGYITGYTETDPTAEPALGNPSVDGYVLVSTVAGARSWVAHSPGTGLTSQPTADNQILQATGVGVYEWTDTIDGLINDSGTTVNDIWSASKTASELSGKADDADITVTANSGTIEIYVLDDCSTATGMSSGDLCFEY